MSDRRVVVTGLGLLTPCGNGWRPYWDALVKGESAVREIKDYDLNGFTAKIAGQLPDFNPAKFIQKRKSLKLMSRDIQLAVVASQFALEDSGLDLENIDRYRIGVTLGAGLLNTEVDEIGLTFKNSRDQEGQFKMSGFGKVGIRSFFPLWFLKYLPNMPACHISIAHGLNGPNNTITTSAASGAQAIGEAYQIIKRGDADYMLAGGADSKTNPMGISRFHLLGLLSQRKDVSPEKAYCPFDMKRDGMVLGEGAGLVMLEERESAINRGAKIYGEIRGYGVSPDFNFDPRSNLDYTGKSMAMKRALNDAKVSRDDVDFVVANGSGIPQDDIQEVRAIHSVFKHKASELPVTAVKPVTGHLIYGSGGVEFAASVLSLYHRVVPPVINLEQEDPRCDLNIVARKPVESSPNMALMNSFGFGGQNASLVVSHE